MALAILERASTTRATFHACAPVTGNLTQLVSRTPEPQSLGGLLVGSSFF